MEDLRSSVVALDDVVMDRHSSLPPMMGGWAELATTGAIFGLAFWICISLLQWLEE